MTMTTVSGSIVKKATAYAGVGLLCIIGWLVGYNLVHYLLIGG